MKKLFDLIGGLSSILAPADGVCESHGPSRVLAHRGVWYCSECTDAKQAEDERVRELAARREQMLRYAHIPKKFQGKRFEVVTEEHRNVRLLTRAFVDTAVTQRRWGALALVGETGNGKTLLACELAESLINGKLKRSARYTTAKAMISQIQSSYGRDDKTEEGEVANFVRPDVLIIDEIDAAPLTANAGLLLNEIIDRRYRNDQQVVVISNQAFAGLAAFVGDRVYSRLHENAFVCAFTGADQRKNGSAERAAQAGAEIIDIKSTHKEKRA